MPPWRHPTLNAKQSEVTTRLFVPPCYLMEESPISPPVVCCTGVLTVLRRSMACGNPYRRYSVGGAHDLQAQRGEQKLTFRFCLLSLSVICAFLPVLRSARTEKGLDRLSKPSLCLLIPLSAAQAE